MRVCVVGNGPSAENRAAEIDACDFVVRTTGWWRNGPPNSGQKLSAYAWFGAAGQEPPEAYAAVTFEHWFTLPLSRCNPPHERHGGNWIGVTAQAVMRPVRFITEYCWQREAAVLLLASKWRHRDEVPPSTGFTAIDMALRLLPVEQLVLYGFDATVKERPGWGDTNPQWRDDGPHDLLAEKSLIQRLARDGRWLGERKAVEVVWPDCPFTKE